MANITDKENNMIAPKKEVKLGRALSLRVETNASPLSGLEESLTKLTLGSQPKYSANCPFSLISRQQNAIDIVTDNLCVFSVEVSDTGARRYFNAQPHQLWEKCLAKVNSTSLPRSHFYEVILPNRPVRLYMDFDLKSPPPDYNFSDLQLTEIVRSLVFHSLFEEHFSGSFRISNADTFESLTIDDLRLVVQSATDKPRKISLHFIWPDIIFDCNRLAGEFVKRIQEKLQKLTKCESVGAPKCKCSLSSQSNVECQNTCYQLASNCLFVNNDESSRSSFLVDLGVYDRNRNWRLWRNTKRAGGLPLKLFKLFGFSKSSSSFTEEQVFLDSLVCPSPELMKVCQSTRSMLLIKSAYNLPSGSISSPTSQSGDSSSFKSGASPFPEVDAFLCNEILAQNAQNKDVSGLIRSWRFYSSASTIVYDISGRYRFCARINRYHRSNHVYFTVSLVSGEIYQRCHDKDCGNFRSFPPWLLPSHLLLPKK